MDILDIFMSTEGDSNILSQFLKFLENDSPLNPSLTGYFHRVFMVLYSRFPHKVSDTIKSSNILPDLLLRHIGSYGIPEILLRLMGGEPEEGTGISVLFRYFALCFFFFMKILFCLPFSIPHPSNPPLPLFFFSVFFSFFCLILLQMDMRYRFCLFRFVSLSVSLAPLNPLRSMTFKAAIRADNDISADENLKVFSFPCPVFFVDSTPRDENVWFRPICSIPLNCSHLVSSYRCF